MLICASHDQLVTRKFQIYIICEVHLFIHSIRQRARCTLMDETENRFLYNQPMIKIKTLLIPRNLVITYDNILTVLTQTHSNKTTGSLANMTEGRLTSLHGGEGAETEYGAERQGALEEALRVALVQRADLLRRELIRALHTTLVLIHP